MRDAEAGALAHRHERRMRTLTAGGRSVIVNVIVFRMQLEFADAEDGRYVTWAPALQHTHKNVVVLTVYQYAMCVCCMHVCICECLITN